MAFREYRILTELLTSLLFFIAIGFALGGLAYGFSMIIRSMFWLFRFFAVTFAVFIVFMIPLVIVLLFFGFEPDKDTPVWQFIFGTLFSAAAGITLWLRRRNIHSYGKDQPAPASTKKIHH